MNSNQKLRRRMVPMRMQQNIDRIRRKLDARPDDPRAEAWRAKLEKLEDGFQDQVGGQISIEVPAGSKRVVTH